MPDPALPAPRPGRPQPPPPAIVRGAEAFPGLPVLEEIPDGPGVILWQSLRNLALWVATPPESREGLFGETALRARERELAAVELDPALTAPLAAVTGMMARPESAEVAPLVEACARISAWAEARGALATALEFTQAAALASPDSAELSCRVGRLARRNAEYDRAESWYTRAIVQGRRSRDWTTYARAFDGLGILHFQRGNFPAASRAHHRALRAARRHGIREIRGTACHNLFLIEIENAGGEAAEALAEEAFHAYAPGDRNVPRLAYDVAFYWAGKGYFSEALRVAQALLPHFSRGPERAFVYGLIARAAGGSGDAEVFGAALRELEALIASGAAADAEHRALLGVSMGAASLGEWRIAQETAARVLGTSKERSEAQVVFLAEAALEAAENCSAAARRVAAPGTITQRLPDRFVDVLTGGETARAGSAA
jgi:tetratricopeptide (TPR) repeat protein